MSRPLFAAVLLCFSSLVSADDVPPPAELVRQAQELRQQAEPFKQQQQLAEQQETQLQQQLLELQQTLLKSQRELEAVQKTLGETEAKLKTEQEAAAKLTGEKQQAQKVLDDAAKALAEAQKQADAAKAALEAATKTETDALALAQATAATVNDLTTKADALGKSQAETKGQSATLEQQQLAAIAAANTASQEWLQRARSAEALLTQAGEWVSFASQVAPVFQQRCLACHNARTAKGRYNMENYAAIMKGGESGPVIEGTSNDALLCIMIGDGSMPKEADPLTAEQLALINRWVDLGAQLDAGLDPEASLIRIMPKFPQPAPPETYRVPIPVTALAFSPDGTLLASSGYHEVLLWSVETGELVRRISNVAERTYAIDFQPDGTRLAIAAGTPGQIGEIKVFQVADGQLLFDLVAVEDSMFDITFSPDGTRLAACGADRAIRLYDAATGAEQRVIEDHADWVMSIAWSPDGTRLVSASRDKTAKVFDATTGDAVATFNGHAEVVTAAAFLADGQQIVSSGRDKLVRVWAVNEAKEARKIGGFGDEVTHLVWLPDNRVLTTCADKQARLHNANDGAAIKTYSGHTDWLHVGAVHPTTGRVATGSYNGEVRIWNLDDATQIREWIAKP